MIVKFLSKIKQNGENREIKFSAPVTMSEEFGFNVYEFKEPQANQMNRIEISDKYVNIFAGSSTLNLELKKAITVRYKVGNDLINLVTTMSSLKTDKMNPEFKYKITNANDEVIGEYHLSLTITK